MPIFDDTTVILCPDLLVDWRGPAVPRTPTLDTLLSRADRIAPAPADPLERLLRSCGVQWSEAEDPPSAPFALLGEGEVGAGLGVRPERDPPGASLALPDAGYWLHADPVHLRPDRDRLLLFSGPGIDPDPEEAAELAARFNAHFAADGLRLLAAAPARWYLRVERRPRLRNRPLAAAVGGSVGEHLPRGEEARDWMRLLNEVQMLFFDSPVNRARERQGRPAIGGIWPWGGGYLPDPPDPSGSASGQDRPRWLAGDRPLTLGLARWAGLGHRTLDDWRAAAGELPAGGLIDWEPCRIARSRADPEAGARALTALDAGLAGAAAALRAGRLRRIEVDAGADGRFLISRRTQRRFWRRARRPVS